MRSSLLAFLHEQRTASQRWLLERSFVQRVVGRGIGVPEPRVELVCGGALGSVAAADLNHTAFCCLRDPFGLGDQRPAHSLSAMPLVDDQRRDASSRALDEQRGDAHAYQPSDLFVGGCEQDVVRLRASEGGKALSDVFDRHSVTELMQERDDSLGVRSLGCPDAQR